MIHNQCKIGNTIIHSETLEHYLCTDIGTRTIIVIHLDLNKDQSWFKGPPYAVPEIVLDEDDLSIFDLL